MSALWGEISEVINLLFPLAISTPLNGNLLLPDELQHLRFLSWRNKGGGKHNDMNPWGSFPVGITKFGVDLEKGRYTDPDGVKIFQSFPDRYVLEGGNTKKRECIGNSVPPPPDALHFLPHQDPHLSPNKNPAEAGLVSNLSR